MCAPLQEACVQGATIAERVDPERDYSERIWAENARLK
jgi:hypothetical protein